MSWKRREFSIYPFLVLLATCLLSATPSECQSTNAPFDARQTALNQVRATSTSAAWRFDGVDPASQQDDVAPQMRKLRNDYWFIHLPLASGLSSRGAELEDASELIPSRDSLWITATFTSFKSFTPAPGAGAYTELTLHVDKVLGNKSGFRVRAGNSVDLDIVGGSIKEPNGEVKHYNLLYDPYTFVPNHRYLLQLSFERSGNFFTNDRSWDLSSGLAIPLGGPEVRSYERGDAHIAGRASSSAVSEAQKVLKENGIAEVSQ